MANKQQQLLEETTDKIGEAANLITDVAEKATSAVAGLDNVASGNSEILDSNKAVLRRMNLALLLGSTSLLGTLGVAGFLFFATKSEMDNSNQMLLEAVAIFATNVEEMVLAQKNVNAYFELQQKLQSEVTYAREALEFIPQDIGKTLQSIPPQIQNLLEDSLNTSEENIEEITNLAIADLSQKIANISENIDNLKGQVSSMEIIPEINENLDETVDKMDELDSSPSIVYGLPQIKSDFEQVILLQKEVSAKITSLRENSTKTASSKKTSTAKPVVKKPKSPFKYP